MVFRPRYNRPRERVLLLFAAMTLLLPVFVAYAAYRAQAMGRLADMAMLFWLVAVAAPFFGFWLFLWDRRLRAESRLEIDDAGVRFAMGRRGRGFQWNEVRRARWVQRSGMVRLERGGFMDLPLMVQVAEWVPEGSPREVPRPKAAQESPVWRELERRLAAAGVALEL